MSTTYTKPIANQIHTVNILKCIHLVDLSVYNNNYYKLPESICGCNILFEKFDGADSFVNCQLGVLEDGEFVHQWWVNQEPYQDEHYIIHTDKLGVENLFT